MRAVMALAFLVCVGISSFVHGIPLGAQEREPAPPTEPHHALLVFTAVENPAKHHKVTEFAASALVDAAGKAGFRVDVTADAASFTVDRLRTCAALVFLNTRGNVLDEAQRSALQTYVRGGGGVVIVHAGMLAEEEWEWFSTLVRARFKDHPKIQPGAIVNAAPAHPVNRGLPARWIHTDEWYNYIAVPESTTVLLAVDESTYEGGAHGDRHPVVWCHEYDGGRIVVTTLGHTPEAWTDELFLRHLLNGITFAAGVSR